MMNVNRFKEIVGQMEFGNVGIQYGETNKNIFNITFTEVEKYEDVAVFLYSANELGEQTPSASIVFDDILSVQIIEPEEGEAGLYGKYGLEISLKNNHNVRILFDVKNEETFDINSYEVITNNNSPVDEKQGFYDAVFSHKGGFQVNVNSFDIPEIEENGGLGMEFHDLYFMDVMPLASDQLISFGNCNIKPTSVRADGVPCYTMEYNSGLYIEKSKIEYVEKLDTEEYADMFELGISTVIYNVYMLADNNGSKRNIVTIGFLD